MNLADALYSTPEMTAMWSAEAFVRRMLDFEAALARAEARAGIIPRVAASAIVAACREGDFDVAALFTEAAATGTPTIPLVRMLTERVEAGAQGFVHWGATSQDVIDTALVLQMRDGLALLIHHLLAVGEACASHAERYRHTPMAGRTLLQQASPITFGLKAARWLSLITRQVRRLDQLREHNSVVQLGGAVGTLASLGVEGIRVTEYLAAELGLTVPDLPWHTERDRVADVAAALGVVAGSIAKIATDIVLLAQTEVGEVAEASAPGKGQSSAMPQKRNSVDAVAADAASRLALGAVPIILNAMVQEHERAAGGWQAEWQALPDVFQYTAGGVERVRGAVEGLMVDSERMSANLRGSRGLIMAEALTMALAPHVGRHQAYHIVREVSERTTASGVDLPQAVKDDERIRAILSLDAVDRIFDPNNYLGSTDTYITRALESFRLLQSEGVPHA